MEITPNILKRSFLMVAGTNIKRIEHLHVLFISFVTFVIVHWLVPFIFKDGAPVSVDLQCCILFPLIHFIIVAIRMAIKNKVISDSLSASEQMEILNNKYK